MHILLEHVDFLDVFDLANGYDPIMNDKQFLLAIKGLRMQAKTKDIAYRILVKGESRKIVRDDTGIKNQQISKTLTRIMENLRKQLKKYDLEYQSYMLPKKLKPVVDALEDEHLKQYTKENEKIKQTERKKKNLYKE